LLKKNSKYSNISLREALARTKHRVTSLLQYSFHRGQTIARMKDSPGLHVKTYLLIFFMVLFAPLGNILLSKGMKQIGSAKNWVPSDALPILAKILTSTYIWLGIASLLAFFVAYMLVLTWADYSYVQPASAFSYAVVAILSYFLLGEVVPPLRWAGIAVICLGVLVVGHTPPRTTEKA
jgi:drug/metabolite transporter (DMT)-like permease